MTKIVYITGCLGFIGSYITKECLDKGWYVRGIDSKTYCANLHLEHEFKKYPNFSFEYKDINDIDVLYECDYIINTAASTHVDNSIVSSDVFVKSNIDGVHHLLNLIKNKYKFKMPTLIHFSTDEVYGDIVTGAHTESDMLKPSNPYSATKAAADMLVTAWGRTYNVPYVIVRPTNNYGIGQYTEKFIPHTIKYLSLGKPAPLHNEGTPRRTWLHASDTSSAIITIINSGITNEIYNISGNYEDSNLSVAQKILNCMNMNLTGDNFFDLSVRRQGQDVRYAIDDSKLKALGWSPKASFDDELINIVDYYKKNFIW